MASVNKGVRASEAEVAAWQAAADAKHQALSAWLRVAANDQAALERALAREDAPALEVKAPAPRPRTVPGVDPREAPDIARRRVVCPHGQVLAVQHCKRCAGSRRHEPYSGL
jgi:hypothetical protein